MRLFKKIAKIFRSQDTRQTIADLEDLLLESGISPTLCSRIIDGVENTLGATNDTKKVIATLEDRLRPFVPEAPTSLLPELNLDPVVCLFVGVNGVGKTTSIAKFAHYLISERGITREAITLAAGDTFRAGRELQLQKHAESLNLHCIRQHACADPAAVIFDAIMHAKNTPYSYVLADTAGRMNTRKDLIRQLQKIYRIAQKGVDLKNIIVFIVIDGNSGLNTISQVRDFKEAVPIDALILSKYDGSSRGGVIISIANECSVPCVFLGTGERYENLAVFDKETYLRDFLAQ